MHSLFKYAVCGIAVLLCACNKQAAQQYAAAPLTFFLIDSAENQPLTIPTNPPVFTVSEIDSVVGERAIGRIGIKLLPPDASGFESLTSENLGRTMALTQGTNIISVAKIVDPISARAAFSCLVETNSDFQSIYREIQKLSKP